MFFPERIKNIGHNDKVLEIGPGADPYFRSDILLEKKYTTEEEYYSQLGKEGHIITNKTIILYDGEIMPFVDDEFDYVICSHVLEHIDDIDKFMKEIMRVGKRGYFEFPTIYYDYIYNFDVHKTFLLHSDNLLLWFPKENTQLSQFKVVNEFFLATLSKGYDSYINDFKDYFFQGFEWNRSLQIRKADNLHELCFKPTSLSFPTKDNSLYKQMGLVLQRIYLGLKNRMPF